MIFKYSNKEYDTSKILDGNMRPLVEMTFEAYEDGDADETAIEIYLEEYPQMEVKTFKGKDQKKKESQEDTSSKEKDQTKKKDQEETTSKVEDLSDKKDQKTTASKEKEREGNNKNSSKAKKKIQELNGEEIASADELLKGVLNILEGYFKKKTPKPKRKKSQKTLSELVAKDNFDAINRVITRDLKAGRALKIDLNALSEVEKQGIEYIQAIAKATGGIKDSASAPIKEYKENIKVLVQRVKDAQAKKKK